MSQTATMDLSKEEAARIDDELASMFAEIERIDARIEEQQKETRRLAEINEAKLARLMGTLECLGKR
jgi:hypothetical protein